MSEPTPTSESMWSAVDGWFAEHLLRRDPVLDDVVARCAAAGLPAIHVAPVQGKLLYLLARVRGARRILEIGTLGGYSTIWLARALPAGGRVVTLEIDPDRAAVAAENFERAGLADVIEQRLGDALESLADLVAERAEPFDLVFVDADKARCAEYVATSLALSRPGTLIVVDNVVRDGAVVDPVCDTPEVRGIRRLVEFLAREPRLEATALQTVGVKGYDGFVVARVV